MSKDFFKTLTSWTTSHAKQYPYYHFPNDEYEVDPLVVYGSYFQITLSQSFLKNRRELFRTQFPAAHTSVRIQHADYDPVNLSHVAQPGKKAGEAVDLNNTVTGLIPYNGGILEIDCGLVEVHGDDYLNGSIKMLSSFSSLVAAPISQALTIAQEVGNNMQDLFFGSDGKIHLNFHQTYTDVPGGNILRPGHYAAILGTEDELKGTKLSVEDDRLLGNGKALTGFDYLLFRIDSVKERPDWLMKDIQKNLNAARKSYLRRRQEEADEYRAAAMVAVFDSPDLSEYDRTRVADKIAQELDRFSSRGLGAAAPGDPEVPLNKMMASGVMSWEDAAAKGVPTLSKLLAN